MGYEGNHEVSQTRLGSLVEVWTNIAIGFGINYAANLTVLPAFGYAVTPGDAFGIGLVFTAIAVARGYFVRRWFNRRLIRRRTYGQAPW